MDAASFYTGLVADLYGPLRAAHPDPDLYARLVASTGEPALELGCGDGDPLLELRRRGLDVEGVDSSADMLERCRRRAADEGIDVFVHHQRMEELDLGGRRFRTIFLAGPTFNLLPDDEVAAQALVRIRDHLAGDGTALVPLFVPEVLAEDELGRVREAVDGGGRTIRFCITSVERHEAARRQVTMTRYERLGDPPEVLERPWVVHWHSQEGFRALAESAGLSTQAVLDASGGIAAADATDVAFLLRPGGN